MTFIITSFCSFLRKIITARHDVILSVIQDGFVGLVTLFVLLVLLDIKIKKFFSHNLQKTQL